MNVETQASQGFWLEVSGEANRDRRRDQRVVLVFPLNICGIDAAGHFFSEDTVTNNISEQGCRFQLSRKVEPGDVVAVRISSRNPAERSDDRPTLFEVRWARRDGDGWLLGTVCLQASKLWKMNFPVA
jgi:hypothetical protein